MDSDGEGLGGVGDLLYILGTRAQWPDIPFPYMVISRLRYSEVRNSVVLCPRDSTRLVHCRYPRLPSPTSNNTLRYYSHNIYRQSIRIMLLENMMRGIIRGP
jgi:hypothetical protein